MRKFSETYFLAKFKNCSCCLALLIFFLLMSGGFEVEISFCSSQIEFGSSKDIKLGLDLLPRRESLVNILERIDLKACLRDSSGRFLRANKTSSISNLETVILRLFGSWDLLWNLSVRS